MLANVEPRTATTTEYGTDATAGATTQGLRRPNGYAHERRRVTETRLYSGFGITPRAWSMPPECTTPEMANNTGEITHADRIQPQMTTPLLFTATAQ
eukprot:8603020-Pyramimonas_sp.AAC.1